MITEYTISCQHCIPGLIINTVTLQASNATVELKIQSAVLTNLYYYSMSVSNNQNMLLDMDKCLR